MIFNQTACFDRNLAFQIPLARPPVFEQSKSRRATCKKDPAMRSLSFAFRFQVIQVATNRRFADIERRTKVRNRYEALAADQFPQLCSSLIRRLPVAQNLSPQTKSGWNSVTSMTRILQMSTHPLVPAPLILLKTHIFPVVAVG